MEYKGVSAFEAQDSKVWRKWLEEKHLSEKAVWLIIYKKESQKLNITYDEAVDEALCFGWIDSKPNKRDEESFYVYFSIRNPKSNWSRVNKEKVSRLLAEGRMSGKGLEMIETAKANGTWDALNEVENLIQPEDLKLELAKYPNASVNFEAFPRSVKRGILEWILNAKRPETRAKRIAETAKLADTNIRANQYRKR